RSPCAPIVCVAGSESFSGAVLARLAGGGDIPWPVDNRAHSIEPLFSWGLSAHLMGHGRSLVIVFTGLLAAGHAWSPTPAGAQGASATVTTPGGDVTILADRLEEIAPDNLIIATGNVEITKGTA